MIDGDRRMVWRGDEEVHVAPKTLDLLLALLGRAPNAMSKAELMTALWPDTHVSDAALHRFGHAFAGEIEREVSVHADRDRRPFPDAAA